MRPIIEPLRSLRSLLRAADGACSIMAQRATDTTLEDGELATEGLVRGKKLAQPHEGAYDVDTHFDGAGAVEDSSGLYRAVLGEGEWELAAPTPA